MMSTGCHVKKLEIKGLWGEKDISIDFNDDYNFLFGRNGSGKTSCLKILRAILQPSDPAVFALREVDFSSALLILEKKDDYSYELSLRKRSNDDKVNQAFECHFDFDIQGVKDSSVTCSLMLNSNNVLRGDQRFIMSNFDPYLSKMIELKFLVSYLNLTQGLDKTTTDLIVMYQKSDTDFNKIQEYILELTASVHDSLNNLSDDQDMKTVFEQKKQEVEQTKQSFCECVNSFLSNKRISFEEDKGIPRVVIKDNDGELLALELLSSGEKHILLTLGEALLQRNKSAIYIADEPEQSLHIRWQEKLASTVKWLNPNAQMIFATHSPDMMARHQDHHCLHLKSEA